MYMVEEYFQLKLRNSKQEMMLAKQNRIIKDQENVLQEYRCFMQDCLDRIFAKALEK